jgi:Metallo-peptidase family M12B Reprolysin-like/Domain of unknown function DUF11
MSPSRRPSLFGVASLVLLACAAIEPLHAQKPDFAILYHERARGLDFLESRLRPQAPGGMQSAPPTLSFVAFQRRFEIDLRPNPRLTAMLDARTRAKVGPVDIYEGELRNAPGSWARLTRYRSQWSGVVFDGVELYAIEPYAGAAPYLVLPDEASNDAPVIYRWNDAVGPVVDEIGPIATSSDRMQPLQVTTVPTPALPPPGEQIDIGLVGDSALVWQIPGGAPEAAMLSMANVIDGIFVTQVGVHLNVTQIESFDTTTDPFVATDPPTLLSELAAHKDATPALRDEGLVHLFTGRQFPGSTIVGIANLGAICDANRAVGLSRVSEIGSASLIAAHEIGHNFGAPHDGEAGACASAGDGYLMSPNLNGSHEFSACSIQQMLPTIASASCLYAIPPTDVSIRGVTAPPTQALLGMVYDVVLAVDNRGADAFNVAVTAVGDGVTAGSPVYRNCTYADPPGCLVPILHDNESMSVSVPIAGDRVGPVSLDVFVQSMNDSSELDNAYHIDFEVLPTVDLHVDRFDANPVFPRPYGTVDLTIELSNGGSVPATAVEAVILVDPQFAVLGISGPGGNCAESPGSANLLTCPIGTLAPGARQSISGQIKDVSGRQGNRTLSARLTAAEPDLDGAMNSAGVNVQSALADLSVSMSSPAFDGVAVGDPIRITILGHNAGPDDADNVTIDFQDLDQAMTVDDVNGNGAACTALAYSPGTTECTLASVAAGADFVVTFSGTTRRNATTVTASAYSDAFDRHQEDNFTSARLPVRSPTPPPSTPPPSSPPPVASGGGGGGGSADIWSLLLLTVALLRRRTAAAGHERRRPGLRAKHSS